jgi:hypothetical protein
MIRYLPHALEALAKRDLKPEWIAETIGQPDWTEPDAIHPGRVLSFKAISDFKGRILRVVHWRDGDDIVVLTVYPDRDALKRRRLP